jgi:hypothetical protein
MALDFIDRLIVVMEQGEFAEAALNVIDRMINSMIKTAVLFLSQTRVARRKS